MKRVSVLRMGVLLFALLAVGVVVPAVASAQIAPPPGSPAIPRDPRLNDSQEPGSVLVFPKFIRGTVQTTPETPPGIGIPRSEFRISVVCPRGADCGALPNFGPGPRVNLRGHWVCEGERNEVTSNCQEVDFALQTTVNGTLYISARRATDTPDPSDMIAMTETFVPEPPCPRGYLIVWVVDENNEPMSFDGLIGDAVIRNPDTPTPVAVATARSAAAYNGIPIQSSQATYSRTDLVVNGGNDNEARDFDGAEYQMLTSGIFGTVRFETTAVALGDLTAGNNILTFLTLLTLDVNSGGLNDQVLVSLDFYNETEHLRGSFHTPISCWRELRLADISPPTQGALLTTNTFGKRGLVIGRATRSAFPFAPVTLLGIIETQEVTTAATPPVGALVTTVNREYAYSLYNDSVPVATTFFPNDPSEP